MSVRDETSLTPSSASASDPCAAHSVGELEDPDILQNLRGDPAATGISTTTTTSTGFPADLALSLDAQEEEQEYPAASYYWDASTMAPLNAVSAVSNISRRLRSSTPDTPPPLAIPPFP